MTHLPSALRIATSTLLACAAILGARAAAAQCATDIDCKGDRVCDSGQCVDPISNDLASKAAACTRDVDCKGDRVCEVGRCVAPTPPSAPAASRAPATSSALAHSTPARDEGPIEQVDTAALPTGLMFIPRVGFITQGSVELRYVQTLNGYEETTSEDGDDTTGLVLGADLLYAVSPKLRIGGAMQLSPDTSASEAGEYSFGTDGAVLAVMEAALPVSPKVVFTMRMQGGLALLFAGGDAKDEIDDIHTACGTTPGVYCSVSNGPFVGSTFGLGAGVMFPTRSVRPRIDLLVSRTRLPFADVLATSGPNTTTLESTLTTTRMIAMAGFEL